MLVTASNRRGSACVSPHLLLLLRKISRTGVLAQFSCCDFKVTVFWLSRKASPHINVILCQEMQEALSILNYIITHFGQKFKLLCSAVLSLVVNTQSLVRYVTNLPLDHRDLERRELWYSKAKKPPQKNITRHLLLALNQQLQSKQHSIPSADSGTMPSSSFLHQQTITSHICYEMLHKLHYYWLLLLLDGLKKKAY